MDILKRIQKIIQARINSALRVKHQKVGVDENKDFAKTFKEENLYQNQSFHETEVPERKINSTLAAHYAALEIPYSANLEVTKKAWKRMVRKYHPDLFAGDQKKAKIAHEITQSLNEAFHEIEQAIKDNRV